MNDKQRPLEMLTGESMSQESREVETRAEEDRRNGRIVNSVLVMLLVGLLVILGVSLALR